MGRAAEGQSLEAETKQGLELGKDGNDDEQGLDWRDPAIMPLCPPNVDKHEHPLAKVRGC